MIPRKYSLLWRNIIWAGVIFFLCAIPSDSIPDPKLNIPHLDKVVHFGMFFIMSIFLCSELRYQTRLSLQKNLSDRHRVQFHLWRTYRSSAIQIFQPGRRLVGSVCRRSRGSGGLPAIPHGEKTERQTC